MMLSLRRVWFLGHDHITNDFTINYTKLNGRGKQYICEWYAKLS